MAEELNEKQKVLLNRLCELKSSREIKAARIDELNKEIKDKIELHNNLVASITSMKKEYKEKVQKFSTLRKLVKEYKASQRSILEMEYNKQIQLIIQEINSLKFELKLNVFKSFDSLKAIKTAAFPILDIKKNEYFNTQRVILKKKMLNEIDSKLQDSKMIAELIFYINFNIRYEMYFNEDIFVPFLIRKTEKEFEYHFLSDRESNRLDKPEWFLDFLVKKYDEYESVIRIYSDCRLKNDLPGTGIVEIILQTQYLIFNKLVEISKIESSQRRNLTMNFVSRYYEYVEKIKSSYSFVPNLDEISHILSTTQSDYIAMELNRIHELRYIQWFTEYKKLCRDTLSYICKYNELDKNFKFKDLIVQILSHAKIFVENLRFINREEIKVVSFVFNEFEELKNYIMEEEREMSASFPINITASSIDKITVFNANIFKLIKRLAVNDIDNSIRKIVYFTYSSNETRRTVIVEIIRILSEYKGCVYSDLIEKAMQEKVDQFIFDEILLKIRFTSDEYLEFRNFYRSLKKIFAEFSWKSDDACKCVDAIFEDRTESGQLFKTIGFLYDK